MREPELLRHSVAASGADVRAALDSAGALRRWLAPRASWSGDRLTLRWGDDREVWHAAFDGDGLTLRAEPSAVEIRWVESAGATTLSATCSGPARDRWRRRLTALVWLFERHARAERALGLDLHLHAALPTTEAWARLASDAGLGLSDPVGQLVVTHRVRLTTGRGGVLSGRVLDYRPGEALVMTVDGLGDGWLCVSVEANGDESRVRVRLLTWTVEAAFLGAVHQKWSAWLSALFATPPEAHPE